MRHECQVGDDCVVHSHVAIRERVRIGHRVVIQNGVVIGSDVYGFAKRPDGTHPKIPQVVDVVIEDDVEIGANTTIDRPAVGETRIEAGTNIDNLVQVAHGVRIGRNVLLAAQVGIAGSSVIEDDVVLAGQVGVAGHLTIGPGAIATAQSGLPNDVAPKAFVSGYPAIDNRDWLKASAVFRGLHSGCRMRLAWMAQACLKNCSQRTVFTPGRVRPVRIARPKDSIACPCDTGSWSFHSPVSASYSPSKKRSVRAGCLHFKSLLPRL